MSGGFTNGVRLDQIRDGMRIDLTADSAERASIAGRLDLQSLDRLDAHVVLSADGDVIRAKGRVVAALTQSCVVTGDPVDATVDEPFELIFMPEPTERAPEEEVELAPGELDVVFHDGAMIDLGGAIADSLALCIDPYPRSAGADAALKEAGVISEEDAGPFAALAQLKKDLGGRES
jgi:uncharacterized metal-binding protein YceD (DUF177 family)